MYVVSNFIERFSYDDLEMKTREKNRNKKRTKIKRFDWFIERIQTLQPFGWLSERSGEKPLCPGTFWKSTDHGFALTSYRNAIGQLNNAFSILGFFWRENTESPCFDFFIHWLIKQITNTYQNHFSRSYENRHQQLSFMPLGRPICKELRQRTHCINSSRSQLRRQQFEANIYVRDPMD